MEGTGTLITERDYTGRDKLSFENDRLLADLSKEFKDRDGGGKTERLILLLKKKVRKAEWDGLVNHKATTDLEDQISELKAELAEVKQSNARLHEDNVQLDGMCKRLGTELRTANGKLEEGVEPLKKKLRTLEENSAQMREAVVKFDYLMGFLKKAQDTGSDCFDVLRKYAYNQDE